MAIERVIMLFLLMGLANLSSIHVFGELDGHYHDQFRKVKSLKSSFLRPDLSTPSISPLPSPSPSSSPQSQVILYGKSRVFHVTSYGADPTGNADSTDAILKAISDAFASSSDGFLMDGIVNLGGAQIDLDGGNYLVNRPLRFPATGAGNVVLKGGSLHASDEFPTDGYLIDLSSPPSTSSTKIVKEAKNKSLGGSLSTLASSLSYNYEYITLRDLMLDSNHRGGGISVINSLRTSIDNCYIVHFASDGILVQGGHETYIRNSFLGQHITAGGDPGERNFSGTGIHLMGNDNAVTDVVIFSASVGIMVSAPANVISGVHCYNKATGFGGTGIYLKLPGLTQTRIVNSYLDYTGIVAEDPVQLHISNCFFLGDAFVILKSIKGEMKGVNIVDNMFSGSGKGMQIVQLDETNVGFNQIEQVVIDRNNVNGMIMKSTIARGSIQGNGSSWTVDLNPTLVFPNLIKYVQYTFSTSDGSFPNHALKNTSGNQVVIASNTPAAANVYVVAHQSAG
ncbi:Pectate lyase superfamily protein [Dillenia turbinata]|uniref:Pectate lyase superfamily protein n=1 Tax=Dillenia turbinata TaxID=194707 RepID=A0AAN8VD79_9MAGN